MKNILKLLKWFLSLFILIGLMSFSSYKIDQEYCKIKKIKIENFDNNRFLTTDIIMKVLNNNRLNPSKEKIKHVSFFKIESLLQNHPSIKKANVFSDIEGNIYISVSERLPIARVKEKEDDYYLDSEGNKMMISEDYTSRLLIVTGSILNYSKDDIHRLSYFIYKHPLFRKQIEQIDITSNNELVLYTRIGGCIEFGTIERMKEKFENLELFYRIGPSPEIYKNINLKYRDQIVCTKI